MSRTARILRNIAANWLGFVIGSVVTLLLTPLVLHELGATRYGIWVLTSSIVGYYGILDLGFRAGLTQHLTRYIAIKDYRAASAYLSSAVAAFGGLACFLAVLSVAGAFVAPHVFDIPPHIAHEAFWCILIFGLGSSVQYALFPYAAIFPSAERFDVANYIGISTRLVTAALLLIVLKLDYGLIGVSAATFAANFIDYVLRWQISKRLVREVKFSRGAIALSRLKDIFAFGMWNFLISINAYAYQHVPNIIIASFMRVSAVGQYALATGLVTQISSLLSPIGQVMYPAATAMHAQDDRDGLKRLYHDGTRMMMLVMFTVVLIAFFWAPDFYRLWIGEQYLTGEPFHSVSLLLQVLLLSTITSYAANIGIQILIGAGRIRMMAIALICGSALSLAISLTLVQFYGLLGITIAVVVASTIIDLIVVPIMVQRVLGFAALEWIRYACLRPLLVAAVDVGLLSLIRLSPRPENWADLILQGILAGAACIGSALAFGVTSDERHRFLVAPFRRRAPI
ncbi:MAG: oligosaccharide flippase family protein [Pseudomonadota bacterium]